MTKNKQPLESADEWNNKNDDEKNTMTMLHWFTSEKLDKKAYWIFLLILAAFFIWSNTSIFFR